MNYAPGEYCRISWQALATTDIVWAFYYSIAYAFGYQGPEYPTD